jgi:hypothetical protein
MPYFCNKGNKEHLTAELCDCPTPQTEQERLAAIFDKEVGPQSSHDIATWVVLSLLRFKMFGKGLN